MLRVAVTAIVGALSVVYAAPLQAQVSHTPFELAMLPDYCKARLGNDEQARKAWQQKMGQNWYHLHHYCSGLTSMRRAKSAADPKKRSADLEFAVKEFNYVLKNWTADFYLVKDAKDQRAHASSLLGRPVPL
jgi:hypothetical protein